MAQILLFKFPDPSGQGGLQQTEVYWDDAVQDVIAYSQTYFKYSGPLLGSFASYEFCSGETRWQFRCIANDPYAEVVTTPNSPLCAYHVCDMRIHSPFLLWPADTGQTNGVVQVRASTTAPPIQYSLNGTTWQSSPVFSNVAPGGYTAYVKDAKNCTAQKDFELKEQPQYGIRWQSSYVNALGHSMRIDLLQPGYTGAVEQVRGAAEPLTIEERGDERDFFLPIRGQECRIQLIATRSEQFKDIFQSDERGTRVDVFRNNDLIWRGWIVPEVYTEPFTAPPFTVSMSATDGISVLKDVMFSDGTGDPEGTLTQMEVVRFVLAQTDTYLPLLSGINLYERNMQQGEDKDPLMQASVFIEPFKTVSFYDVLRAILEPYGAFIRQCAGTWQLSRVEELKGSFVRRRYNWQGAYQSHSTFDPVQEVTPPSGNWFWVERSQMLELLPGYRQVEVIQDFGLRENLAKGGDFAREDFNDDGSHKYFSGTATFTVALIDPKKPQYGISVYPSAPSPSSAKYIQIPRFAVRGNDGAVAMRVVVEYYLDSALPSGSTDFPEFMIELRMNDKSQARSPFNWRTQPYQWLIKVDNVNTWRTFDLKTVPITENGYCFVRIYQAVENGENIDRLLIRKVAVTLESYPEVEKEETHLRENARKFFHTPEKKEIALGDVPTYFNALNMYENTILVNGKQSWFWTKRNELQNKDIIAHLADTTLAYNSRAIRVLRGALKGPCSLDKLLTLQDGMRFVPASWVWRDKAGVIEGTFLEIIGTGGETGDTDGALLLETGAPLLLETGENIMIEA